MVDLIVNCIVVLLICGFIYWVYLRLIPLAQNAEPFLSVINVLVVILVFAVVLFYAVIPLLHALARAVPVH